MSDTTIEQVPGSEPAAEAAVASDEQLVAMLVDRVRSRGPASDWGGRVAPAVDQAGGGVCPGG